MTDIYGRALLDYQSGNYREDIKTFSSLGEEDILPLPYLFRKYESMPILEQRALGLCKGKILDIGCGAGSHALYLQNQGLDVTGLDISEGAIATCRLRGLVKTLHGTVKEIDGIKFDTLLLLMNGIGIAGSLANLSEFLIHIKSLLNPGGQILLDSSDIIYMFDLPESVDPDPNSHLDHKDYIAGDARYYGEVTFTMEYGGEKGSPFKWLYLDFNSMLRVAIENNLSCQLVMKGAHYDYLARLSNIV